MNVVLLYTGNVGSTPTVEYLRTDSRIFVPVHEDFDEYLFKSFAGSDNQLFPKLVEVLTDFYGGRCHPFFQGRTMARYWGKRRYLRGTTSTLFKWRPFAPALAGADEFRSLMRRESVRPVILRRRSLIEQATKVRMNEVIYGNRWPQFGARELSERQYTYYIAIQKETRIDADSEFALSVKSIARNFLIRSRSLLRARDALFPASCDGDLVAVTEELFRPNVQPDVFETYFGGVFGFAIRIAPNAQIMTRKAGLGIENCRNYETLVSDPELQAMEHEYQTLSWSRS